MGTLIASIVLFIMAVAFFLTAAKNTANLLLALSIFIASIGSFGSTMEFNILPYLRNQTQLNQSVIAFLEYLYCFLLSLGHFVPYAGFLAFTVYFSGYMEGKKLSRHIIYNLFFFSPTIASFILFPVERQFHPDFRFLTIWNGLYLLISTVIQLKSYRNAFTTKEKRDRLFVIAAIIPAAFLHFFTVSLTQALGNKTIWHYGYLAATSGFVVYLAFIIKFGTFGLRVKIEKMKMDTAMKTINSSTLIFNHAVKNEVAKISMCADLIKSFQEKMDNSDIKEKICLSTEILDGSVNHLLKLVDKIKENSQPVILNEEVFSLKELVDSTLKPFMNTPGSTINIRTITDYDYQIIADYTHLKECLSNIVNNAMEALKNQGNISVTVIRKPRFIALLVEDDGPGISGENLPYLFDPFYSTKKSGVNFGLGLFYCYNVMKKHKGNIEVSSTVGAGTIVSLILPVNRVLAQFENAVNIQTSVS